MFGPSFLAIKTTKGTCSRVLDCLVTTTGHPSSNWSFLITGYSFAVCKDTQRDQMSDEKEVKLILPKSLMVVLWVAATDLVLNGVQPLFSTPANAVGGVQKMAICNSSGALCARITAGAVRVFNLN